MIKSIICLYFLVELITGAFFVKKYGNLKELHPVEAFLLFLSFSMFVLALFL